MRYYCSDSKNSQLIIDRFVKMCSTRDQIFLAGPKGSEYMLLLKEYCDHFKAELDSVINIQISMLDDSVITDILKMLEKRGIPQIIAVDMRNSKKEVSEAILLKFLETPDLSNARIFVLLDEFDPFGEKNHYSQQLTERAKSSLFVLPPLKDRLADIAHFSQSLLREYSLQVKQSTKVKFDKESIELMLDYPWPGNYDELSAVIKIIAFSGIRNGMISKGRLEEILNLQRTSEIPV